MSEHDDLTDKPGDGDDASAELTTASDGDLERASEPPVVARMMIEIRSDGSRTIARGAVEELETGTTVAIEAHGRSPIELAWSLAKTMAKAPSLARSTARALLPSGDKPARRRSRVGRLVRRLRRGRGDDDDR